MLKRFLVNKNTILDCKRNLFKIKDPQQTLEIVSCNQCHFLRSVVRKRAFLGCVSQFEELIIDIVDPKKKEGSVHAH